VEIFTLPSDLVCCSFAHGRVQAAYIATSRELKRLDALAFSPIFQHFGESLAGLITIRAFNKQQLFIDVNKVSLQCFLIECGL
jgi:hypothetical protein